MPRKYSPESMRERVGGRIDDLMDAVGTNSTSLMYRILNPLANGFPNTVFDLREDLAERIARAAGTTVTEVRDWYMARWSESKRTRYGRAKSGTAAR